MADLASRLEALGPEERALLRERLAQKQAPDPAPVAIVGIGCRFPGAKDPEAFWSLLSEGREAISVVPEARWRADDFFDPDPAKPGKMNTRWGGFLDDVDRFDASFFGISPREAEGMDPQHRLLLEVAWAALEDAGYAPESLAGSAAGIFVGIFMDDYRRLQMADPSAIDAFVAPGTIFSIAANRLSYFFDFHGPSVALDTACSSSLVAVHLACQALRDGDATFALAGGVNVLLTPGPTIEMAKSGLMAPDGRCKSFDARANGYVRGEGAGLVALKLLSRALEDGDRVYAVIRGSAVNQDGRSNGLTAPNPRAQEAVIREAYRRARIAPSEVDYVEAHGSGTAVGDPIEAKGLGAVVAPGRPAERPCRIGAVKTNFGHLETAAGVAGLIKVALSLAHGELPPTLNYQTPSPLIPFDELRLEVVTRRIPWPERADRPGPAYAGVSSFGFGGTNAHVVLAAAPARPAAETTPERTRLLVLSAPTPEALEATHARLANDLAARPDRDLGDVAWTLTVGRQRFQHRKTLIASTAADAAEALLGSSPERVATRLGVARSRPIAFLLPGLGDHYVNMGAGLYRDEPVFRHSFDRCAELFRPHLGLDLRAVVFAVDEGAPTAAAGGLDLRRLLRRGGTPLAADSPLARTEIAQPAVFAFEIALAALLASWGIRPAAVLGYSLGEYTAACLAGVFSLEAAVALVAARAQAIAELPMGAMLAIPLPEAEARGLLRGELGLAAVNGPALSVLSGPVEGIEETEAELTRRGTSSSRIPTTHAFHSRSLVPAAERLAALVRTTPREEPRIPILSNLTGRRLTAHEATDPEYWARHMCETVRFADGLAGLSEEGSPILVEVGPGFGLSSLAKLQGGDAPVDAIPTVRNAADGRKDRDFLLGALGRIWLAGGEVDLRTGFAGERRGRVSLPTYPFERKRYWHTARQPNLAPVGEAGRPDPPDDRFWVPVWKQSPRPLPRSGPKRTLVLSMGPFGRSLADRLAAAGDEVALAEARLEGVGGTGLGVVPGEAASYERLLEALPWTPERVVHLWLAEPIDHGGRRDLNDLNDLNDLYLGDEARFARAQEWGFLALVYLARALGSRRAQGVEVVVVTEGVEAVAAGDRTDPDKATVRGALRVVPQEYLGFALRAIDIDRSGSADLVGRLAREVGSGAEETSVAYRGGQRWVEVHERIRFPPSTAEDLPIRPGGVYVVTGGLGEVGSQLAEGLATSGPVQLVLLGRTEMPTVEERDRRLAEAKAGDPALARLARWARLEHLGARVEPIAVDVADERALAAALADVRSRLGPISGVIHAAGTTSVESLRYVAELGPADCAIHDRSKVRGTRALAKALGADEPDWVVLCSSISTVVGGLGFASYVAANSFLDAFAAAQCQAGKRWLAIDWDTWRGEAGSRITGVTNASLALAADEGREAFSRALQLFQGPRLVISVGDLERRIDQWIRLSTTRTTEGAEPERHERPTLATAFAEPRGEVETAICEIWQRLLGIQRVGRDDDFFELGGQSLIATQLFARLRERFGVDLGLRSLFDAPTPARLAAAIEAFLWLRDEPAAPLSGALPGAMVEGEL